jgi:hypothetical protein
MVNGFYQAVLIPWQHHDDIWACSLGIAMSGVDGMDSILEYVVSDVCWFLLLSPIVPGAE